MKERLMLTPEQERALAWVTVDRNSDPVLITSPFHKSLYGTIREFIVANMFDGDDSGLVTMRTSELADEVAELISTFLIDGVLDYYEESENEGI